MARQNRRSHSPPAARPPQAASRQTTAPRDATQQGNNVHPPHSSPNVSPTPRAPLPFERCEPRRNGGRRSTRKTRRLPPPVKHAYAQTHTRPHAQAPNWIRTPCLHSRTQLRHRFARRDAGPFPRPLPLSDSSPSLLGPASKTTTTTTTTAPGPTGPACSLCKEPRLMLAACSAAAGSDSGGTLPPTLTDAVGSRSASRTRRRRQIARRETTAAAPRHGACGPTTARGLRPLGRARITTRSQRRRLPRALQQRGDNPEGCILSAHQVKTAQKKT